MKIIKKKIVKQKIKKGDLVKVMSGKWKKTVDYVSMVKPKKGVVYLKSVSRLTYSKKKEEQKESVKVNKMIPIRVCKVSKEEK